MLQQVENGQQNLLTTKGIGVNVNVDNETIFMLVGGVFLAVLLGAVLSNIITKNL